MKLAIRIFALLVVVAGGAAATTTPKTATAMPSRLSATDSAPIPQCGPGMNCPTGPGGGPQ
ncbi:MAG: hypothetical protein ABR905_03265 [Terracidiphilus sp.]